MECGCDDVEDVILRRFPGIRRLGKVRGRAEEGEAASTAYVGDRTQKLKRDLVEGGRAEVQDQTAVVQEVSPGETQMSQPGTSRPLRMPGYPSPIRRLSLRWTSSGLDPRGQ